jgi:hypothetical protein
MPSGGALEAMASRHHLLSPVIEWFSAVPVVFRRSELLFLTDLFWTIEASLSHGFVLLPEFPVVLWVSLCLYCVCVVLGFVLGSVFCSHSVFLFVCVYCVISIWCCVLQFFVNLVLCVLCFVFVCACVPDFILLLLIYFFNVGWLCRWFGLECWLVLLAMDVRWGGRGVWSCWGGLGVWSCHWCIWRCWGGDWRCWDGGEVLHVGVLDLAPVCGWRRVCLVVYDTGLSDYCPNLLRFAGFILNLWWFPNLLRFAVFFVSGPLPRRCWLFGDGL